MSCSGLSQASLTRKVLKLQISFYSVLGLDWNIPLFLVLEPAWKGQSLSAQRERASCPKAKAITWSIPSCFSHCILNEQRVGWGRRRPFSWLD